MWRQWAAAGDQIDALEETERSFGLQRKLMWALTNARLYGGAAMVIGIRQDRARDEPKLHAAERAPKPTVAVQRSRSAL